MQNHPGIWFPILSAFLAPAINSFSQNYITNPGFEGPDGIEVIPSDWFAGCGVMNTPDTQPGWWNVENKPFEGKAYIDLLFKEDGTTESVYQKLAQPLDSGGCYLLEIHLAQACQDSLSGLDPYGLNHPGDLIIRGSEDYGCGNGQVLADFKQIANCRWETYYATFQAQSTIQYIYLEFSKGTSAFNNGSVLIDWMVLENSHPLPPKELDIAFSGTVTLDASMPGGAYTWLVNDSIVAADTSTISIQVTSNLTIDLNYFSEDGCLIQEQFKVLIKPHIPNVLTFSDGDHVNDVFYIDGLAEEAELYIFNRWGEIVFHETPYSNSWIPKDLTQGVYFYQLSLKESGRIFTGSLTLF